MGRTYETAIKLSAELDKRFGPAFLSAEKALAKLGKAAEKLKKTAAVAKRLEQLGVAASRTETQLAAARAEVTRLAAELEAAQNPSEELKAQFAAARGEAKRLERELARQRTTADKLGGDLRDAGVDTRRLGDEQRDLEKKLRATATRMDGLSRIADSKLGDKLKRVGSELRGVATAAGALAVGGLYKVGQETVAVEEHLANLAALPGVTQEAIEAVHKSGRRWSEAHGTSVQTYLGAAYEAFSSGFTDTDAVIASIEQSQKVAAATKGDVAETTKLMGTLYNNVADPTKSAADELARLGDVVTLTQQAFALSDMGQLSEGFKYALSGGVSRNVPFEQIAAVVGQLNTRSLEGSQAGTAFAASLSKMADAAKVLKKYDRGFEIAKTADGGIDYVTTLQRIQVAIGKAEKKGKLAGDVLDKAFGVEGARAVSLLLNDAPVLTKALEGYANGAGATDRAFAKLDATPARDIARLTERINNKLHDIGVKLLPIFERVIPKIEALIDRIPAAFERLFEIAGKVAAFVESIGGIETVLYAIAAIKLGSLASAVGSLALAFGKLSLGVLQLAAPETATKLAGLAATLGPYAIAVAGIAASLGAIWWAVDKLEKQAAHEKEVKLGISAAQARAAGQSRNVDMLATALDTRVRAQEQYASSFGGWLLGGIGSAARDGTGGGVVGERVRAAREVIREAITYSPTINVQGGAQAGPDVERAVRAGADDLEKRMHDARRRSFD